MTPHLDDGDVRVYAGDCVDVMRRMDAASVDAVVTDPPYGLGFMGQAWDTLDGRDTGTMRRDNRRKFDHVGGNHNPVDSADAARTRRVEGQKFGEWCETWAREALRVLKPGGHLLAFGGTRTYHRLACAIEDAGFEVRDCLSWLYGSGFPKSRNLDGAWAGWGTALKPAWEPIVLARRPLAGTVAANVQAHGTGALNIDGCRIPTDESRARFNRARTGGSSYVVQREDGLIDPGGAGRWPANVALDEDAAQQLDEQSGERTSGSRPAGAYASAGQNTYGRYAANDRTPIEANTGGASRFFYTAKASSAEREAFNTHPTVKPINLMRWLVRMVTPPGGLVLDPFAGSGTTLLACRAEGVRGVGIEREDEYLTIIARRLRSVEPARGAGVSVADLAHRLMAHASRAGDGAHPAASVQGGHDRHVPLEAAGALVRRRDAGGVSGGADNFHVGDDVHSDHLLAVVGPHLVLGEHAVLARRLPLESVAGTDDHAGGAVVAAVRLDGDEERAALIDQRGGAVGEVPQEKVRASGGHRSVLQGQAVQGAEGPRRPGLAPHGHEGLRAGRADLEEPRERGRAVEVDPRVLAAGDLPRQPVQRGIDVSVDHADAGNERPARSRRLDRGDGAVSGTGHSGFLSCWRAVTTLATLRHPADGVKRACREVA